MAVLTATGVQPEAHLPFAGLHQLLQPVREPATELPEIQRTALDAAFGLTHKAAPEHYELRWPSSISSRRWQPMLRCCWWSRTPTGSTGRARTLSHSWLLSRCGAPAKHGLRPQRRGCRDAVIASMCTPRLEAQAIEAIWARDRLGHRRRSRRPRGRRAPWINLVIGSRASAGRAAASACACRAGQGSGSGALALVQCPGDSCGS